MSKIVIVFSTYYNSPVSEEYLFSKETTTPGRFSSKQLCDYFWKQVDLKTIAEHRSDYLSKMALTELQTKIKELKEVRKTELKDYLNKNKDAIDNYLKKNANTLALSTDDFDWIAELSFIDPNAENNVIIHGLIDKYDEFNKNDTETCIDVIKNHFDGVWLSKNLKDTGSQTPLDTVLASGVTFGENRPWLHYRFSYYKFNKLEGEPDDVSVYAVWPLQNPSPDDNGKKSWIEALTDQFLSLEENADVEVLYLILHDKDIESTPFKIFLVDEVMNKQSQKVSRYVALFQHTDEIGKFLGSRKLDDKVKSLEDIKQIVSKQVSIDHFAKQIAEKVNIGAMDDPSVTVSIDVQQQKKNDDDFLKKIAELDEDFRNAIG